MIIIDDITSKIDKLKNILENLLNNSDIEKNNEDVRKYLKEFNFHNEHFNRSIKVSNDPESILRFAIDICECLERIATTALSDSYINHNSLNIASTLFQESTEARGQFETFILFEAEPKSKASRTLSLKDLNSKVDDIYKKMNAASSQHYQTLSDIEERINYLRKDLSSITSETEKMNSALMAIFKDADDLVGKSVESLKDKEKRAEELLELISRDTISGSYQQSAAEERKVADWLRYSSLFFMVLMTFVMGITLWESSKDTITLQDSIFRLAIVMILSIPAAYLARESSRHRTLENTHHRVSLELKSVDPYLSSLPEEKRNIIKEKLANRIFMGSHSENEPKSAPISSHELIEKLIEKLNK